MSKQFKPSGWPTQRALQYSSSGSCWGLCFLWPLGGTSAGEKTKSTSKELLFLFVRALSNLDFIVFNAMDSCKYVTPLMYDIGHPFYPKVLLNTTDTLAFVSSFFDMNRASRNTWRNCSVLRSWNAISSVLKNRWTAVSFLQRKMRNNSCWFSNRVKEIASAQWLKTTHSMKSWMFLNV